jgi:hypothetical protein
MSNVLPNRRRTRALMCLAFLVLATPVVAQTVGARSPLSLAVGEAI